MSRETIEHVLTALARRQPVEAQVAVVVAHPDDETVGAGPFLHLFRRLRLVHVTDGAPRDLRDVHAAGFTTCAEYASARRCELLAALRVGGVTHATPACPTADLPIADQSASHLLAALAVTLRRVLRGAEVVLTHAYEGGHPDHDAVAFAVHAAGLPIIEMIGYHAAPDGGIEAGRFLPNGDPVVIPLTDEERTRRDAMLACFTTQQATLAPFLGWTEARFRAAPRYDFTRPAAPVAYYDGFDWGTTSAQWRVLAAQALRC